MICGGDPASRQPPSRSRGTRSSADAPAKGTQPSLRRVSHAQSRHTPRLTSVREGRHSFAKQAHKILFLNGSLSPTRSSARKAERRDSKSFQRCAIHRRPIIPFAHH